MTTAEPGFDRHVPDRVYHYTSAQGLLGIVRNGELWASESTSLNDLAEIRQGWNFVRDWVRDSADDRVRHLGWLISEESSPQGMTTTYVLSASSEPDDANQWRLYADGGYGYAVELDTAQQIGVRLVIPEVPSGRGIGELLKFSVVVSGWKRCLYEDVDKMAALEACFENYFGRIDRAQASGGSEEELDEEGQSARDELYGELAEAAALMKSRGFLGENEYRVVIQPLTRQSFEHFRPSRIGVVSYVTLGAGMWKETESRWLSRDEDPRRDLPVTGVRLGPLVRPENARTIEALLRQHQLSDAVAKSEIPLG